MLKPDQALPLAEQTRVRLTIEPIEWSPQSARAAWEAIKAQLRDQPLHFGGQHYSRDELHERR
jgi:hypothetical protein